MKKLLIATALTFAAVGTASANIPHNNTSPNLDVLIKNGIATIYGQADSGIERKMAVADARKLDGVDKVIDLSTHN